jgi:hypothetical protein
MALLAIVKLGLSLDRADQLVERLLHWQWPDGGWNCHGKPTAASSSVYETLLPMRGLAAYATARGDAARGGAAARSAARYAAQVLLDRRVLYRRTTGRLIRADWAKLHYPVYWHYDVLAGLRGLTEAGLIGDARCQDALDLLERKQLPGGGWAAEVGYYRGTDQRRSGYEHVDWGGIDAARTNEWVTADALAVLTAAGRR